MAAPFQKPAGQTRNQTLVHRNHVLTETPTLRVPNPLITMIFDAKPMP